MNRLHLSLLAVVLLTPGCGGGSEGLGPHQPVGWEVVLVNPAADPAAAAIEVRNIDPRHLAALRKEDPTADEWSAILRVTVEQDRAARHGADEPTALAGLPAVAGAYSVTGDAIVFKPLFGFDAGRRYDVAVTPARVPGVTESDNPTTTHTSVSLPKAAAVPSTIVDRVYPSGDVVPENLLRLYIHFSAPMGLKGGLDYIRLLDDRGVEVEDPFLPLDAELWNGDRTRFTVFLDPGRVKRGILPNKQLGRSLTSGRPYTLVVSPQWRDGQGLPLKEEFRRVFRVAAPDEEPLDQRTWRLDPPRPGTRDPLAVHVPEPLDHGLLLRALGVVTAEGGAIPGETRIESGETRWTFTPRAPWTAGGYRLRVLTILEDLAGNRIGRAFEVDRFDRADRSAEPEEVAIPFRVGGR